MQYSEILDAVYENRFPSSSPAAQWVEAAYTDVWYAAPWSFREVYRATWYATSNGLAGGTASATPPMPAGFESVIGLYDQNGDEIEHVGQQEFDRAYAGITAPAFSEAFTVVNRQVHLAPTPDSAYAFQLSYRRRPCHKDAGGATVAGFMSSDTDTPFWDDHHYILVIRAKIIGLRDRSDPTASDLEGEYVRLLSAMREAYVDRTPRVSRAWA